MISAPLVDPRTARDFEKEVRRGLSGSIHGWPETPQGGASDALVQIFAHYCEVITERINRVPDKTLLQFANLLGASSAPAQPASVPLTFFVAPKTTTPVRVPALTQVAAQPTGVAAQPTGAETELVIFETVADLIVTPATLDAIWVRDPARDRYADLSALASVSPAARPLAASAFRGDQRIPHAVCFPLQCNLPEATWKALTVHITAAAAIPALPGAFRWELLQGNNRLPLIPLKDETANLAHSGAIQFSEIPLLSQPPSAPAHPLALCLHWEPPETIAATNPKMPQLDSVEISIDAERTGVPIDLALWNAVPLDASKDFFPFGERPKIGDALYLSSTAFSAPGATVTLHIDLANPASRSAQALAPVNPTARTLIWEVWTGRQWSELGVSQLGREPESAAAFVDTTNAFAESGIVRFVLPPSAAPGTVFGRAGHWIRVRLATGDFAYTAALVGQPGPLLAPPGSLVQAPGSGPQPTPPPPDAPAAQVPLPTVVPPLMRSVRADASLRCSNAVQTATVSADMRTSSVAPPFQPFPLATETEPSLYFGFDYVRPVLPDGLVSVYLETSSTVDAPALRWEYWNGRAWAHLVVADETNGLTQPGRFRFLPPGDIARSNEFGILRFWIRVRPAESAKYNPVLRRALLNTVFAEQTITTREEVLGSSNGRPGQLFHSARKSVLEGQILTVKEPASLSLEERRRIEASLGPGAISETGDSRFVAVRWVEVPALNESGPADRHYQMNHAAGEILFGDGVHGRIPPPGTANIILTIYRTGGGAGGNKPAFTITQMKSSVPHVQSAANIVPSGGGGDPETNDRALLRTLRTLRHSGRAVTREDYEDLALEASSEITHALCLPDRNLLADPAGRVSAPGVVSLIIAARGSDKPEQALLDDVSGYLSARQPVTAKLVVVAPELLYVDVAAEITPSAPEFANDVIQAARDQLKSYLDPTLGRRGQGWNFAQIPYESELIASLRTIGHLDHIRSLQVTFTGESPDTQDRRRFIIKPRTITVTATLEN
jgi:hypothetical protein